MILGPRGRNCLNSFRSTVVQCLFTKGTLRHPVQIDGRDIVLTLRVSSHPGEPVLPTGSQVDLGWDIDMSVLPEFHGGSN